MRRNNGSPISVSPPHSYGSDGQRSTQSSIPSPRQWAFVQSQEDLPSPIPFVSSNETTPVTPITYQLIYHNEAERNQQSQQRELEEQQHARDELEVRRGIAYQVHNVSENIKDNYEEIIQVIGGRIDLSYLHDVGPDDIIGALGSYFGSTIARRDNTPFGQGEEYTKIFKIFNKLHLAKREYLGVHERNEIFTWIQFVMRQPDSFQFHYITCFIEDTFLAYNKSVERVEEEEIEEEEKKDYISCPKGILERLFLSIADACVLHCVENKKKNKKKNKKTMKTKKEKKNARNLSVRNPSAATNGGGAGKKSIFHRCDNQIYRALIKLFKKEIPDMNELTKEWAVIFTGGLADSMTTAQIKQEFIDFMVKKYIMYGINNNLPAIQNRADEFDEIFERREF